MPGVAVEEAVFEVAGAEAAADDFAAACLLSEGRGQRQRAGGDQDELRRDRGPGEQCHRTGADDDDLHSVKPVATIDSGAIAALPAFAA